MKNELLNGKCKVCGACGLEGCCPPSDCNMTGNNIHCKHYLQQLKISYNCAQKIYSLMYKNKEKHPELWHDIENIWEGFIHSINIENNVS